MSRVKLVVSYQKTSESQVIEITRDDYERILKLMRAKTGVATVSDFGWNPEAPRQVTINLSNVNQIVEVVN